MVNFDDVLAYGNKTNGRDKLLRMTQYLTKLLRWYLIQQQNLPDFQKKLKIIESQISTGRKLFRLGRTFDSWRSAQKSINLLDPVLRVTITCTHINKAFFLLVDHYLWFAKVGLIKTDTKKWDNTSSRFYLASLISSVFRDLYAIEIEMNKTKSEKSHINFHSYLYTIFLILKNNPPIAIDLTKNLCDIVIPASRLGFMNASDGVIGVLGTISSVLAAYQVASTTYKLKP